MKKLWKGLLFAVIVSLAAAGGYAARTEYFPHSTHTVAVITNATIGGGAIDSVDITGGTIAGGAAISGSTIDDTPIGGTTPAAGDFTTATADDLVAKLPIVDVRAYASIHSAVTAIGSTEATLLISDSQSLASSLTIPSTTHLSFSEAGKITCGAHDLVINGPMSGEPVSQRFDDSGAGSVSFGKGYVTVLHPEYWGAVADDSTVSIAALQSCVDAAESSGIRVEMASGIYRTNAALTIQHPIIFEGQGNAQGIVQAGWDAGPTVINNVGTSNNAIEISVENPSPSTTPLSGLILRNFDVEGAGAGAASGHGIVFAGLETNGSLAQIRIENVSSYSNKQDGFRVEGVSFLFEWTNPYAASNGGSGMRFVSAGAGVPGQQGVTGGLIYNNVDSQVNIEAGGSYDFHGTSMSDDGSAGAAVYGLEVSGGARVSVFGGFFESNNGGGDVFTDSSQTCRVFGTEFASAGTDTLKIASAGNLVIGCRFLGATKQITYTAASQSNVFAWPDAVVTIVDNGTTNQFITTAQLEMPLGSVGAPVYSFSGDGDTGLYRPTGNRVGMVTAGTEVTRWGPTLTQMFRDFVFLEEWAAKTSNYEATDTDYLIIASGVGTIITLPENATSGTRYVIKRVDAANAIVVSRKTADTIDGATSKSLDSNYAWIEVISDGQNYHVVGQGGTVT